jgi:hypothetical protein
METLPLIGHGPEGFSSDMFGGTGSVEILQCHQQCVLWDCRLLGKKKHITHREKCWVVGLGLEQHNLRSYKKNWNTCARERETDRQTTFS